MIIKKNKISQIEYNDLILESYIICKDRKNKKSQEYNKIQKWCDFLKFYMGENYNEFNWKDILIKFVCKWKILQVNDIILLDKNTIMKIYWNNVDYSTENSNLFEKIAKEIVKLFKWWNLTINKLRQYYQSVVNLYNAYERKNEEDFKVNELKTDFNLLLAKINYDIKRQSSKVPQEMYDFVKFNKEKVFENNDKVKENFKIFRKHFETIVAYSVWVLKKN